MRFKTVICREGLYYLLVIGFVMFGSILREVNLLMVIAGMMLFPFFFNWRAAVVSLRRLSVKRQLTHSITAGELLVVNVEVKKRSSRNLFGKKPSWAVKLEETIINESMPATIPPKTLSLLFWRIPVAGSACLSYSARLYQRGMYKIGPSRLSTGFPLGLIRHYRLWRGVERVVVFPRCGNLTPNWMRLFHEVGSSKTAQLRSSHQPAGDFHGLRDWRIGDGRRLIHWRSTARRGSPVVRQFEQQQQLDLNLLVDLLSDSPPGEGDEEVIEATISFAATIVTHLCHRGNCYLRLAVHGNDAAHHAGPVHLRQLPQLLTALATASAPSEDCLRDLLQDDDEPLPAGTPTLILSPRQLDPHTLLSQYEADHACGAVPGAVTCIHTAGAELQNFFEVPM